MICQIHLNNQTEDEVTLEVIINCEDLRNKQTQWEYFFKILSSAKLSEITMKLQLDSIFF